MNVKGFSFSEVLACPNCRGSLVGSSTAELALLDENAVLNCKNCDSVFEMGGSGFLEMVMDRHLYQTQSTSEEYAGHQETSSIRVYEEFLKPYLLKEPFQRILDVGCGIGQEVSLLLKDGYEAYGIDLPNLSKFWAQQGNDPHYFYSATATQLPFPDNSFDVVYSLGVIEHIGTKTGHCTLVDEYEQARQDYAHEILRVAKPGGRILIACPNKSFPIDIQHGPGDELTSPGWLRNWIYLKTGMNIHSVWGRSHLLSYSEVKMLFRPHGVASSFNALPLHGYFGFGRFQKGFLKLIVNLAMYYVEHLPSFVRQSFLNPYMLLEIRKSGKTL